MKGFRPKPPIGSELPSRLGRVLRLAGFCLLVAGCEPGPLGSEPFMAHDSAGVRIVVSFSPQSTAVDWLGEGPIPAVSLGEVHGDQHYVFNQIRDARRLSDGRIAVADGSSQEVRFFSPDGAHLYSVGGDGGGPGEFRHLRTLFTLPGDTLLAFDPGAGRLTRISPAGAVVSTRPTGTPPTVVGLLPDGSVVYTRYAGGVDPAGTREGFLQPMLDVMAAGGPSQPTRLMVRTEGTAEVRVESNGFVSILRAPLSRPLLLATDRGGLHFAQEGTDDVHSIGLDGRTQTIRRVQGDRTSVTSDVIAKHREETLGPFAAGSPARELRERVLETSPFPAELPRYQSILVDRLGFLWLERFRVTEEEPWTWRVFHPDGHWVADVPLPSSFMPTDIGRDYILGIATDHLDVESVQLFPLDRP